MANGNGSQNGNGHVELPLDEDLKERIEFAAAKGANAFWEEVRKVFPEVTTGDFSPSDSMNYIRSSIEGILAWLAANHPAPDIENRLRAIQKVI